VNRCEVDEAFYAFFNLFGYNATLFKQVAALHDAVSDSVDFVQALQCAVFWVEQELEYELHTFLMIGHIVHNLFLAAVFQRNFYECFVQTNTLCATLCKHTFVSHIVQFVLDRATTTI